MKNTAAEATKTTRGLRPLDSSTEVVVDCTVCGTENSVSVMGNVGSRVAKCHECGQVSAE